ncbi:ferritin-like domain-containing protein [Silvibacterium sp.]|uniref:YciE/YciF ferroxidase family protein n=1 Tax=Silvibacterium sp. TaxID=1964179 RepID=UPI0039E29536
MSLNELLVEELRDLYSAENQLTKALPRLAKGAEDQELKDGFTQHLEQTKEHVERLKQVFSILEEKPTGKHCNGMEGLIEEGKEALGEEFEGDVYDLGLIGAAARVEHYEIAGYTAAIAMADALGQGEIVERLKETLKEEEETRDQLEQLLHTLVERAAEESDEDEEEEEEPVVVGARKSSSSGHTKAKIKR